MTGSDSRSGGAAGDGRSGTGALLGCVAMATLALPAAPRSHRHDAHRNRTASWRESEDLGLGRAPLAEGRSRPRASTVLSRVARLGGCPSTANPDLRPRQARRYW